MLRSIIVTILMLLQTCHYSLATEMEKKTYIVHMAKSQMPASFKQHTHWYDSSLKSVSESAETIYVYENAMNGFSAMLTAEEARDIENRPGVLSVWPETKYELHTTRTPMFLGLSDDGGLYGSLPEYSATESDVVIGVLDSGVWPEIRSFKDDGLGPVPSAWKGECETGTNFTESNCNRKLIGARYFSKGYEASAGPIDETKEFKSPRDDDGHGTHTASTAAGSSVPNASLFGYAPGTARGMAPRARVAVYKVCWKSGCFNSDILAAMDKAIKDGVDILSLSLGGFSTDYYSDSIAIGAFAAVEKGILVSCSAANSGPATFTLSNVAPWIVTVGAGTLDRDFPATVSLGSGKKFSGVSLYHGDPLPAGKFLPFVYAGNVSNGSDGNLCLPGSLDPAKVKGKIVLCDRGSNGRAEKGSVVKSAGGAGMVLANTAEQGEELLADSHLVPAAAVGLKTGDAIRSYIFSESKSTATIYFHGTKLGVKPSPVIAAFSSRGPNGVTREILKPDIIAPGVNILAGWTGMVGPTGLDVDTRQVEFNIMSGTSMSCPHVSGLAVLLKAAQPAWSPAAIRSALMTTAYTAYKSGGGRLIDAATGQPSTPFDHGSGHVDPVSALDPGLIYDITVDDYLKFLCALNYTPSQINTVSGRDYACESGKKYSVADLNYPSFAVLFSGSRSSVKHTRILTNVGGSGTYRVSVSSPDSVKVSVEPQTLSFSKVNEKKSFTVTFSSTAAAVSGTNVFGRIEWSDGKHVVGSPVAVSWI